MPTFLLRDTTTDALTLVEGTPAFSPVVADGSYEVRAVSDPAATLLVKGEPAPFDPLDLFGTGDVGFLIDARTGEGLWQDTAATSPVTAAGQSVALAGFLGATGLRRFEQGTSGNRPVYQTDATGGHLLLTGGDKWLAEQSPAWNGKQNVTVAGLVELLGSTTERAVICAWRSTTANNYVTVDAPGNSPDTFRIERRAGTTTSSAAVSLPSPWLSNHDFIGQTERLVGGDHISSISLNGAAAAFGPSVSEAPNALTAEAWQIGRRPVEGDRYWTGKIRVLVAISRLLTSEERTALRAWMIAA
jgi:hypothetical protein